MLSAFGCIKSESALNMKNYEYEGAWQIEISFLFHLLIVGGKKQIAKSFCSA